MNTIVASNEVEETGSGGRYRRPRQRQHGGSCPSEYEYEYLRADRVPVTGPRIKRGVLIKHIAIDVIPRDYLNVIWTVHMDRRDDHGYFSHCLRNGGRKGFGSNT